VAMAIGAALGVSSLATLWLVRPALGGQHVNNPVNLGVPSPEWLAIGLFLAVVTLAAGVLGAAKAWLDLATLAWLAFMILMVKEAHEWHIVVPLAWVASPVSVPRPRPATAVRGVRLLFVAYVAARVMVN